MKKRKQNSTSQPSSIQVAGTSNAGIKPLFSVTRKDFEMDFFRCSGHGGQNVNKVETGVRFRHAASGAVGQSCDERKQGQNKEIAFKRCVGTPEFQRWLKIEIAKAAGRELVDPAGLGKTGAFGDSRTIRDYRLFGHKQIKDRRTKHVRLDVENVLDGDIESFVQAFLKQ